jgi:carboxymethylenebutenolidase
MTTSTTEDGVTYVGPADGAPVLLLHSWWGLTPAVQEWAEALAATGRRAVVPDLFAGRTATTEEEAKALLPLADYALVQRCAAEISAQGRPWGAVGFSMGAMYACDLAGHGEVAPDAIAVFYGGAAPAGEVLRTRTVQVHHVPEDDFFTAEELAETEAGFRAAGARVEAFEYPGAGHWFAERESPAFDEDAFRLAVSRVAEGLPG